MRTCCAHGEQQVDVRLLDLGAAHPGVGGDVVDVQLQGVRPGLLDLPGVAHPAPAGDPVEAADDGDAHGGLGPPHVVQVALGRQDVVRRLGEVGQGLGVALRPRDQDVVQLAALVVDLLLEQRVQHHRPGPGVLHPAQVVQAARERRGRGHQGVGQRQAQVGRGQVGHRGAPSSPARPAGAAGTEPDAGAAGPPRPCRACPRPAPRRCASAGGRRPGPGRAGARPPPGGPGPACGSVSRCRRTPGGGYSGGGSPARSGCCPSPSAWGWERKSGQCPEATARFCWSSP